MHNSSPFLSTLTPGPAERRAALAVAVVSLLVFLALAPFAKLPLQQVPAFLPIYQSALVVCDLITAVLLLGQFSILRSRALLVLACGYVFSALMAVAHALSFPGLFAPMGLMGSGPQTTAWLYFLWHGGFPLFIVGYSLLNSTRAELPLAGRSARLHLVAAIGGTFAFAAAMVLLATAGHGGLPVIMAGDSDAPTKALVALATWAIAVAALLLLWYRRPHAVLDLWLMVVLCVWIADTALAAVLNGARYDLGWYTGRIYGLVASAFVLVVLLLENGMLYAQLEAANRDLDAFAGALAHDLQQPITTIGAFTQVIQSHSEPLPPAQASHLKRIAAAADSAHRMIRGLLEFARLGQRALETTPVDLNELVREARNALAHEAETRPVIWSVAPLPVVRGDRALLLLAFVNLLSNGLKYSRTREQAIIAIESPPRQAKGHVVQVRDNGVGFDMAQAGRLFTPFERLHAASDFEGTGLGLANVRRIMERHGGSIHAQSAPGEGATFTLVFPN